MARKMLIDAAHPEETRVVVVSGNRVEEFDFETQTKKQLKGNIYLAKVTRVEPSLQAAFVEYGGNRHGFLAFSEIHPDYYQIPHEDRLALLAEQAEEDDYDEDEDETPSHASESNGHDHTHDHPSTDELSVESQRAAEAALHDDDAPHSEVEEAPASFDEHVAPTEDFDQQTNRPSSAAT